MFIVFNDLLILLEFLFCKLLDYLGNIYLCFYIYSMGYFFFVFNNNVIIIL